MPSAQVGAGSRGRGSPCWDSFPARCVELRPSVEGDSPGGSLALHSWFPW